MSFRTLSGFFRSTCPICYSRDIRFSRRKTTRERILSCVVLHPPLPVSELLESILEIGIDTTLTGTAAPI